MESNFVDYVKILCRSGKGGKGSMHLKHVKYNPNGGPDGGDGGKGGSIYLRGNHNYWTLLHLKYERHIFAEHGGNGGRDKCHGTDGKDIYIDVPCGTVVYNAETGKYVCDVTYDGQEVLLLKGGRGGLGNFQFRTATNQAPRYAQPGEPMQDCDDFPMPASRRWYRHLAMQSLRLRTTRSQRWSPRWASWAIATASRL